MNNQEHIEKVLAVTRNAFNVGKTRPLSFRREQLKRFLLMIQENMEDIQKAVYKDLKKHKVEVSICETELLIRDAKEHIKNLKNFAAPDKLPTNLLTLQDTGYIEKVPYGVVLIIGSWNYPILVTLQPVIGAIAAGNCVVLKPSEIAHHTSCLIAKLFLNYLDGECYHVVQGNPEETQQLLTHKFDYIFYTGSTNVGRLVMQAAANHLTPVTLELGGKSPCYIDDSSNVEIATKRILWGRLLNVGQTCISPDYVLCSRKVERELLQVAAEVIKAWYEGDAQLSAGYSRIINEKHCLRLKGLLETTRGKIIIGGKVDVYDLFIEPTIVVDVTWDDPLMQDEIFGPILPIVTVNSAREAIEFINSKPRPLALYSFSNDSKVNEEIKNKTISGGVCFNDTVSHGAWNRLPFGGIGDSGMGNYHGKYSFDTFTHNRACLNRSFSPLSEKIQQARYPPYTDGKRKLISFFVQNVEKFDVNLWSIFTHLFIAVVSAVVAVYIYINI